MREAVTFLVMGRNTRMKNNETKIPDRMLPRRDVKLGVSFVSFGALVEEL